MYVEVIERKPEHFHQWKVAIVNHVNWIALAVSIQGSIEKKKHFETGVSQSNPKSDKRSTKC